MVTGEVEGQQQTLKQSSAERPTLRGRPVPPEGQQQTAHISCHIMTHKSHIIASKTSPTLVSAWSGATPERTRPKGVGSASCGNKYTAARRDGCALSSQDAR